MRHVLFDRESGGQGIREVGKLCFLILIFTVFSFPVYAASLFNSSEKISSSIGDFPKWIGVIEKQEKAEESNNPCKRRSSKECKLSAFLDSLHGLSRREQLKHVNRYQNRHRYIQDIVNWGIPDYWESIYEFLKKDGDCEDYAIAKYISLKRLGFDTDQMRIVVLQDRNLGVMHAVLAVYDNDTIYILDNQTKAVLEHTRIHHYAPVYSINEHAWWRHIPRG